MKNANKIPGMVLIIAKILKINKGLFLSTNIPNSGPIIITAKN